MILDVVGVGFVYVENLASAVLRLPNDAPGPQLTTKTGGFHRLIASVDVRVSAQAGV